MLQWLKLKWANLNKFKKDDFKKDEEGHALANRYDVDKVNEPEDFATPSVRLPKDKKSRDKLKQTLEGSPR